MKRTDNNMDAVRYVLAFSVVVAHFNYLCGFDIPWPVSSSTGVGGFFALSGFLIYRNFDHRPMLRYYILSRAIRILPPYFFIVLLCAFMLAPFSSLPPEEYFTSAGWWKYISANLAFMNFIEPSLPGVFDGTNFITSAVNGSLWTMKVEWCLYLSVPIVALLIRKLHCQPQFSSWVFLTIVVVSIGYSWLFSTLYYTSGKEIYAILGRQVFGQLSFFYIGVLLFYHLKTFLRYKWLILVFLLTGVYVMKLWPESAVFLKPPVEGSLVIWFSMVGHWGHWFSRHDNVSYDIYLFHFPLIQLGVYLGLPVLGQSLAFMIIITAVTALSFLSWNLIGRNFMRLKPRLLKHNLTD